MFRKGLTSLLLLLLFVGLVSAQEEGDALRLRLNRDFGFGMGANIQGTFSYRVSGPDDLARVVFLLDSEEIGEDIEAPFRLQFRTESYALGVHTMSAVGYASDGRILQSNNIQRQFVAGSESTKAALWLIIPILVIAVGGRLLTSWIAGRKRPNKDQPAIVGPFGGTLCPKCGRPFAMHIWGLNIGLGKYDRCPHCGKWSVVRRVNPDALYDAVESFKDDESESTAPALSEEERLRKQLDDSRFDE